MSQCCIHKQHRRAISRKSHFWFIWVPMLLMLLVLLVLLMVFVLLVQCCWMNLCWCQLSSAQICMKHCIPAWWEACQTRLRNNLALIWNSFETVRQTDRRAGTHENEDRERKKKNGCKPHVSVQWSLLRPPVIAFSWAVTEGPQKWQRPHFWVKLLRKTEPREVKYGSKCLFQFSISPFSAHPSGVCARSPLS